MEEEKIPLDKNNPDSIYNWLGLKIKSPSFRNIIKDFIDDNCSLFIDVDENTFQQGQLFNEFTQLIENILGDLLLEGGITQEQFLTAAERGLNDPNYKKYFDQLLNFSDYTYFKKMMTQRNYHLIQEVEKEMEKKQKEKEMKKKEEMEKKLQNENKGKNKKERNLEEEEQRKLLYQMLNKEEEEDLQKAIQKSLEIEEERRRIAVIEEEELKRVLKQSLLESNKAKSNNDEKKPDAKTEEKNEPKKEEKKEDKKEDKKPEPKKEEFKIQKNDMINFEQKEKPISDTPSISTNKNSFNIISNNDNFQVSGNIQKEEPKPNKSNYVISGGKGFEFKVESQKSDFGISSLTPTTIPGVTKNPNPYARPSPSPQTNPNPYARPSPSPQTNPNPYARPSPSPQSNTNLKVDNSHIIKQDLIDDAPEPINNEKKKTNDTPIINNQPNENKNDNKKSVNLLQFEDNTKEENIIMANEIKGEKASDIIKNTLNENKIKEDKDDGGLLIDDEEEDANNFKPNNGPKTNTFIDKTKDINLGKLRLGKDGGNFLNNFRDMSNYEKGGMERMEKQLRGTQYKSVVDNQNEDDDYQNKLREVENEKQAKLREYREYLLKMKKEKRENKAKEVLSPEELAKLESKKRLAEQLKAKRK